MAITVNKSGKYVVSFSLRSKSGVKTTKYIGSFDIRNDAEKVEKKAAKKLGVIRQSRKTTEDRIAEAVAFLNS